MFSFSAIVDSWIPIGNTWGNISANLRYVLCEFEAFDSFYLGLCRSY